MAHGESLIHFYKCKNIDMVMMVHSLITINIRCLDLMCSNDRNPHKMFGCNDLLP